MQDDPYTALIRPAVPDPAGPVWADLGSGEGTFTRSLLLLTGPDTAIFSIDRDADRIMIQRERLRPYADGRSVTVMTADFTASMPIPMLSGILMANSLHFVADKQSVLRHLRRYLVPGGRIVLVEYDTDDTNVWVPYPLSFDTFRSAARQAGFGECIRVSTMPSTFLHSMYCAVALSV